MSFIEGLKINKKNNLSLLKFLVENRMELCSLVKHVTWEDILDGRIIITEDIANREIKPLIQDELEKVVRISNMDIFLKQENIIIVIEGKYGILPFRASLFIKIRGFEFYPGRHFFVLNYREEISSLFRLNNENLMKIINDLIYSILRKSFTQKGLDELPGIIVDKEKIIIDLDSIPKFMELYKVDFINTLLSTANIEFMSCDENKLVFKINFVFDREDKDSLEIASTELTDFT